MEVFWKLVKGELRQQLVSYADHFNVDLMHQGDQKVEQYTNANRVSWVIVSSMSEDVSHGIRIYLPLLASPILKIPQQQVHELCRQHIELKVRAQAEYGILQEDIFATIVYIDVFIPVRLFVGWFVCRITQKLQDRFPQNLVKKCDMEEVITFRSWSQTLMDLDGLYWVTF